MWIRPVRTARDCVGYNNEMWNLIYDTLQPINIGWRTKIRDLTDLVENAVADGLDAIEHRKVMRSAIRKLVLDRYGVIWW